MGEKVVQEVELMAENIEKCQCPNCPVQGKSTCFQEKIKGVNAIVESEEEDLNQKSEDIPEVYCASGIAACKDLDRNEPCICPTCPVWEENNLLDSHPNMYFCFEGEAK